MLVLGIDTATKIGSIALYDDTAGCIGEMNIEAKTNHSAIITKMLKDLLELTEHNIKDIDRIAVTIGPGSFTGIRIGVALAKGLAYALGIEIVGINELDLIANNIGYTACPIISMIDARNARVYYSNYQYDENGVLIGNGIYKVEKIEKIMDATEEDNKVILIGDGVTTNSGIIQEKYRDKCIVFSDIAGIPRAAVAARLSLKMEPSDLYLLEPYYANKSQAERTKEKNDHENCL